MNNGYNTLCVTMHNGDNMLHCYSIVYCTMCYSEQWLQYNLVCYNEPLITMEYKMILCIVCNTMIDNAEAINILAFART